MCVYVYVYVCMCGVCVRVHACMSVRARLCMHDNETSVIECIRRMSKPGIHV